MSKMLSMQPPRISPENCPLPCSRRKPPSFFAASGVPSCDSPKFFRLSYTVSLGRMQRMRPFVSSSSKYCRV